VTKYIVRRLFQAVIALFMLSMLLFAWLRSLPGGPVSALLGERSTPADREALERALGIDQPIYIQYWRFLTRALRGDFGTSTFVAPGQDALAVFFNRLPATIELSVFALVIAISLAIPLGYLAARYRGTALDTTAVISSLIGVAVPVFFLAFVLRDIFAVQLGWLPPSGRESVGINATRITGLFVLDGLMTREWDAAWDAVKHLILPAFALASIPFVRMLQLVHGDPAPLWRDSQIRAYLGIIAAVWLLILVYEALWRTVLPSAELAREVMFHVVTIISGTGFASVDVTHWGYLPFVLLFFVGLVGGCTGSTVCSIKVFRYQVLFQALRGQLTQMQSPHRVRPLRLQGRRLDPEVVNSVMAFFTMFVLSFGVLIVALALTGLHPRTALTAAWTAIANIGPVWGPEVTANGSIADFPPSAKWLMIAGMYLGRLELITVFVVLMPRFWRQ